MLGAMLHEAWRAMGANRLRTLLTMLGMVIGVGAVVLMMAIGQGAQYTVAQTINSMGSNIFVVLSGFTTTGGVRSVPEPFVTLIAFSVFEAVRKAFHTSTGRFCALIRLPRSMRLGTTWMQS